MFNDFISLLLYLFVGFFSYIFFVLAKQERKKYARSPLSLFAVIMAVMIPSIFAGLRYDVGTDFGNYDYQMNSLRQMSWSQVFEINNMELGYVTIVKFLTIFFSNPLIFGIISALTLAIVIYTLLTQYQHMDCGMMYFIYLFQYYFSSYNIMRQNMALAIVFFSYKYIYEHNFKRFILVVLFAASIHYSALVFVLAYFLWNKPQKVQVKNGGKLLIGIVVVLVVLNFRKIIVLLSSLGIPYISKFLYLLNDSSTAKNRDIIVSILILAVFWLLRGMLKKENNTNYYMVGLFAINVAIGFTGFYTPFFKRCALYYEITQIILMSKIPKIAVTKMQRYVLRWGIMICYVCLFILSAYILGQAHLIPYQTIFEK